MPKERGMAQLSRPFQVALGACVLFAALWFALLHRPGSTTSTASSSAPSAPAHPAPAKAMLSAHAASGTAARDRSHAVAAHSDPARPHTSTATRGSTNGHTTVRVHATHTHTTVTAVHAHSAPTSRRVTTVHRHTVAPRNAASTGHAGVDPARKPSSSRSSAAPAQSSPEPAMQAIVAAELKQGKTVLLLFWNPQATDDAAVHRQVQAVAHKLGGRVAVHSALSSQVGSFGSITRDIQVYQTPTLLIVNRQGQVTTLTGYTEAFAIEQAIAEARG
jgi:hypothetical protein